MTTHAWRQANLERARATDRASYARNRDKITEKRRKNARDIRDKALRKAFGIGSDEYDTMHDWQEGVCSICHNPETRTRMGAVMRLSVDHDHVTGWVRGLLCQRCNTGLGHFLDSAEMLRAAADYIDAYDDRGDQ